jgi:GNAT superfamily N-acetyltransferase
MTTFRPMDIEKDAEEIARLYNFTTNEMLNTDAIIDWWTPREGEIRVTRLAQDELGTAIGYWDIDRETWMKPGHFKMKVVVAPEARWQGLGSQMYRDAVRVARQHGATHLEGYIRETDTASVKFAETRGFKIVHHGFESTLDLTDFDEHRFDDLIARLRAEEFCFFSLAEAGVTEENKRKLYQVNRDSGLDNPGNDESFPDFYAFSKNVFEASWFRADTQILAAYQESWVALSAIGIYAEDHHAYNAFTGVLREYRGRGLAQALKLQTILLAKREGMRYVRTHNDSNNVPMLAVNRKLGYKPEPGYYHLLCVLDEASTNPSGN